MAVPCCSRALRAAREDASSLYVIATRVLCGGAFGSIPCHVERTLLRIHAHPQEKTVASQAWRLLESWGQLPGESRGDIDARILLDWVEEAHRLAVQAERGGIGDEYIGKLLSHSPAGVDGIWPHPAVRDVIESMRNSKFETGIIIGVHNNRGVTSRGMLDGGQQERDLAQRYNRWAEATKLDYPRTSAMLREIARSYENHARDFDDEAERNDWRY